MKRILKAAFIGDLTWRRVIRSLILIPLAVCFGLLIIAMFFPDRVIFQPQRSSYRDTADIIKIKTIDGESISAKFYQNPDAKHTILFSHGNAEDIGINESFALRLRDSGFNILAYDFRGYGTSDGSPSEENAYADIDAAYEYLISEKGIAANNIILHGRSLGGAVAVDLASRRKVAGLIIESTFTTALRVITRYPILPFDKFKSIDKIGSVRFPVLIIHGTNDRSIPIFHGERLFEAANEPKTKLWVEGAGHNDLFYTDQQRYLNQLAEFAESLQGTSSISN
jgi:fermentation-respiration switch protein FrsA (DUF1100 family)